MVGHLAIEYRLFDGTCSVSLASECAGLTRLMEIEVAPVEFMTTLAFTRMSGESHDRATLFLLRACPPFDRR